jgi:excinuclease ABC subunit C
MAARGKSAAARLEQILELVDRLPTDPGCYLFEDRKGRIIYVGKAASLRARVRSYFTRSGDTRSFVALLGRLLGDIKTVVTSTEKEAILLENTLIKAHQPRFNVKLRDDKNFISLKLDLQKDFPRLEVVRRLGPKGGAARHFGPYHSASQARQALRLVNQHFKLRTCTDHVLANRSRPCLEYQIKRCLGPCVLPVTADEYGAQIRDVSLFLEGREVELCDQLKERMLSASQALEYERAAGLRDQLKALTRTLESQRMVSDRFLDQDVMGLYREADKVELCVLTVRQGKLTGSRPFSFSGLETPSEEIVSSFVTQYYLAGEAIPDEVVVPVELEDAATTAEWLRERRGKKVELISPQRGDRRALLEMAVRNAEVAFVAHRRAQDDARELMGKLQRRLRLTRLPRRIECYDMSHLQGQLTVGSMVVFEDGQPAKARYRHFKVRAESPNDFASMLEVLTRRFKRAQAAESAAETASAPAPGGSGGDGGDGAPASERESASITQAALAELDELSADTPELDDDTPGAGGTQSFEPPPPLAPLPDDPWRLPDLLVVDGGKGQLNVAIAVLRELGLWGKLDVISLAKERELAGDGPIHSERTPDRVFLPRQKNPVLLRQNTAELFLLARLRDEAHRFAITFHKQLRRRRTLKSALADAPGIGAKRQRALLTHFGSLKRVREATAVQLAAVEGMSAKSAEDLRRYLDTLEPVSEPAGTESATAEPDEIEPDTGEIEGEAEEGEAEGEEAGETEAGDELS